MNTTFSSIFSIESDFVKKTWVEPKVQVISKDLILVGNTAGGVEGVVASGTRIYDGNS